MLVLKMYKEKLNYLKQKSMAKPKILAFAGSLGKDSFNKKLTQAVAKMAEAQGAEVTYVDISDYPMPLFNEDLEKAEGMPEAVVEFKNLMKDAHGYLISTPEYNGALSGVLKNCIDWMSRSVGGDNGAAEFKGKVAGIMSASPGRMGGIRGLPVLRHILTVINMHVIPSQVAFGAAHEGFNEDGSIKDPKMAERIEGFVTELVETTKKLSS